MKDMKGGMWRMHAFSHTSCHIISCVLTCTDTQQHRDATHTYTRTCIHAHRCMYMSRYVAYLLHPFIVCFIHIYDSLQGAGNGETPARVYKICEYIPQRRDAYIHTYLHSCTQMYAHDSLCSILASSLRCVFHSYI